MKVQINGKIYYAHGFEQPKLLKCPYNSKQSADSMQYLSKFHWNFSKKWKKNLKTCLEPQRLQITKAILRKKNKARGIKHPDFKLCHKATVVKTI